MTLRFNHTQPMKPEEINIISEVLKIHPEFITEESIHECSSLEIAKCMRAAIDQQKAEIEKQSELLKEAYDVIMMLRPTNAGLGGIAYRLKNYKNCPSYKSQLTEANQRGEKYRELLKTICDQYFLKGVNDKNGTVISDRIKQALSEYESTKVK